MSGVEAGLAMRAGGLRLLCRSRSVMRSGAHRSAARGAVVRSTAAAGTEEGWDSSGAAGVEADMGSETEGSKVVASRCRNILLPTSCFEVLD
jgi:hypothetical protein